MEEQAHNTQNWELYFSPDGGDTWSEISKNIGVSDREYKWVVPEVETAKGRIRVVQNNVGENYEDISPNFSIELPQAIGDDQNTSPLFVLFPNPAKERLTCSLHLPGNSEVQIMLMDCHGKTVGLLFDHILVAGNHELLMDISHLQPGLYFCLMRMGEKMSTRKLIISR